MDASSRLCDGADVPARPRPCGRRVGRLVALALRCRAGASGELWRALALALEPLAAGGPVADVQLAILTCDSGDEATETFLCFVKSLLDEATRTGSIALATRVALALDELARRAPGALSRPAAASLAAAFLDLLLAGGQRCGSVGELVHRSLVGLLSPPARATLAPELDTFARVAATAGVENSGEFHALVLELLAQRAPPAGPPAMVRELATRLLEVALVTAAQAGGAAGERHLLDAALVCDRFLGRGPPGRDRPSAAALGFELRKAIARGDVSWSGVPHAGEFLVRRFGAPGAGDLWAAFRELTMREPLSALDPDAAIDVAGLAASPDRMREAVRVAGEVRVAVRLRAGEPAAAIGADLDVLERVGARPRLWALVPALLERARAGLVPGVIPVLSRLAGGSAASPDLVILERLDEVVRGLSSASDMRPLQPLRTLMGEQAVLSLISTGGSVGHAVRSLAVQVMALLDPADPRVRDIARVLAPDGGDRRRGSA